MSSRWPCAEALPCREGHSAGLYGKEETIMRTRRTPTPVASDDDRILKITRRGVS